MFIYVVLALAVSILLPLILVIHAKRKVKLNTRSELLALAKKQNFDRGVKAGKGLISMGSKAVEDWIANESDRCYCDQCLDFNNGVWSVLESDKPPSK